MSDLSQSQTASLVLNPGDVYRISTGGTATVKVIYGAPSGTTTITANFATFGPYDAPAKLDVTAVSGTASYSLLAAIPVTKVAGQFTDPVLQSLVSGAGERVAPSSRAIRGGFAGAQQSVAANLATFTWGLTVQFDQPFDAIRPILFHSDATPVPGVKFCVASNPNYIGDKLGNSLTWVQGTFAGSATATLAAGTVARPTPLLGDLTPCPSVARSDGGSGYMAMVRVLLPTGGTLPQSLFQVADYSLWNNFANNAVYSDRWAGDGVTTPASYAGSSRTDSPIWGVEVLSRGRVISVIEFGDSITRGQGKAVNDCYAWGEIAAQAATERAAGISVLNGNAGYSGQTTTQYLQRAQDLIPLVKPSIAVYAAFGPNDYGGTITQALIDAQRYRASVFVRLCQDNGVLPVLWTGLPAATNKAWNAASDNLRKAFNAELKAVYAGVALVVDMDAALTDGASPANMLPAYTTDWLHPIDAGYAAMAAALKAQCLDPVMLASR